MKLIPALVALLLATTLAPAAAGDVATAETVTANLEVSLLHVDWRSCVLTVPAASNVGHLLDAAVDQGCIDSWSYDDYPGFGRYVTAIDGFPALVVTYWAFYVDDEYAVLGIDDTTVEDGHTYAFNYEQWVVPTN